MDIDAFLNRTHRTKADLLRDLGQDPKSSIISAYKAGRSKPSFDVCVKLLQLGMTPRELFGEEIDEVIRTNYSDTQKAPLPSEFDTPEFRAVIEKAVMDMKARGFIK